MIKPLFIPAAVITHGKVCLEKEIHRLEAIAAEYGENWPDGFDVNDISLFQGVSDMLSLGNADGYEEEYWWGKSFKFFVALLKRHVEANEEISAPDAASIQAMIREYHIRRLNIKMVDGCFREI